MKKIVSHLLEWYYQNKRVLPWRMEKNPYYVWVSEIMLQQTRIEAVINYYHRFIKELPTIQDLASCDQDKLLKLWEGLGYYNRVRNLQRAAQLIIDNYNGIFPNTYQKILDLPGIGEYTASAISSICFSQKEPTVDGNVLRVYMRINNCYDNISETKSRKKVRENLKIIMPADAGDFNEALMELGETVCLPNGLPKCDICPISKYCKSYKNKTYLELPVKSNQKEKKEEYYTIFLFTFNNMVAISKRKELGLLHNLWQFPNVSGNLEMNEIKSYLGKKEISYLNIEKKIEYIHIFTHKKWYVTSYLIELDKNSIFDDIIWATLDELNNMYAIPTAFQPLKELLKKKIGVDSYDEA